MAVEFLATRLRFTVGSKVLDLAAGTGKLTRALLPYRLELVAVEPTAEMRSELERRVSGVRVLDGTAERIPLPDHGLDAVAVGQAFHWFQPVPALDEIARVLRPGGGLAVVFNRRDEREPWVAELSRIVHAHRPANGRNIRDRTWREVLSHHPRFERLDEGTFDYLHRTDPEGVLARVLSVSYIAVLPAPARDRVAADVRELVATHPATAGRSRIDLPYRTEVTVAATRSD